MSLIHLFNPENDLALAHGKSNYTAPPNAMALHHAGEALPFWFANSNDVVIAPNLDPKWLDEIKSKTNIEASIFNPTIHNIGYKACPWGWSLDALSQLTTVGVNNDALISPSQIEDIRQLSHRRTTIEISSRLNESLTFQLPSLPFEAKTTNDVIAFAKRHNGCYIKSPWSSSGRGVVNASALSESELTRRAEGIIRRQGSIMCEAPLDKITDFAMLFYSDGIKVKQMGYSLFFTGNSTAYSGNITTSDAIIEHHLSTMISIEQLHNTSHALENALTDIIAPKYTGFFGVDMLIYNENGANKIAPCIEVNLRMTMGIVAWHLYRNHLAPNSEAIMRVEYGNDSSSKKSPIFEAKKLVEGTLSLIPPGTNFHITLDATRASKMFQFSI